MPNPSTANKPLTWFWPAQPAMNETPPAEPDAVLEMRASGFAAAQSCSVVRSPGACPPPIDHCSFGSVVTQLCQLPLPVWTSSGWLIDGSYQSDTSGPLVMSLSVSNDSRSEAGCFTASPERAAV